MIPTRKNFELPLLRVILDSGGELKPQAAYALVESFFPEMTAYDKELRDIRNQVVWKGNLHWARHNLANKGYLFPEPHGIWKITPKGTRFLEEHWSSWKPDY
ncbi:MAG: winged helix-turn-helix domain-containing protein [Peptococcaceae bacterium]|jgi:hypothetical protein|nr:winged helix-turn-helix domain-containing protein [Peptococcaceae bacterium]